jgi:hypothetical protein
MHKTMLSFCCREVAVALAGTGRRPFRTTTLLSFSSCDEKSKDEQRSESMTELPAINEFLSDKIELLREHMVSIVDDGDDKNDPLGTIFDLAL